MSVDPHQLLDLAVELTERAGRLARDTREQAITEVDTKSTPTDVVTAADRAAERLVVEGLREARPGDSVLGEESGSHSPSAPGPGSVRWILDPIDGTVNYLYGLPQYAVSLAAEVDGVVVAGVVRNPASGELYTAVRGDGAYRDGARLSCSGATRLDRALVGTGFAYDRERRARQARLVADLLPEVRDIRRFGAAALDLCFVAEGRLDAYFERGLHPWDHAAGALVAVEAGARVGGLHGAPAGEDLVLAAAPALFDTLHAQLVTLGAERI
ncbi:MAG: inositol monophosphatase family protein [Actinocatenispora sp.]